MTGLPEPGQALLAGLHRGLLHQAARRPRAAREVQRGVSSRPRASRARSRRTYGRRLRRRARGGRAGTRNVFKDRYYLEVQAHDSEGQARAQRRSLQARARSSDCRRRDERRALPAGARTTTRTTCCSASASGRTAATTTACTTTAASTSRAPPEMRRALPRPRRRAREHAARSPTRSDVAVREEVPRPVVPAAAGGRRARTSCSCSSPTEGARERYGEPLPDERAGAARLRARRHHEDGLRRLLPDRRRLHQGGARPRHPGRARAAARRPARSSPTRSRITDVCPLKFDLLFERFLNPERVSMPDIDVDFCFERRGEVIEYVRQKYGKESVGQIVTFGTMKSRAADQGRRPHARLHAGGDRRAREADPERAELLAHGEGGDRAGPRGQAAVRDRRALPAAARLRDRARRAVAPHGRARGRRRDRAGPARRVRAGLHAGLARAPARGERRARSSSRSTT